MTKRMMLVLTNAVEGRDQEFNEWYDRHHAPEVLETRGFVAARRFALDPTPGPTGKEFPYRYLAIYEMADGVTVAQSLDALAEGRETRTPLSSAMAEERVLGFFEETGEWRKPT